MLHIAMVAVHNNSDGMDQREPADARQNNSRHHNNSAPSVLIEIG